MQHKITLVPRGTGRSMLRYDTAGIRAELGERGYVPAQIDFLLDCAQDDGYASAGGAEIEADDVEQCWYLETVESAARREAEHG